MLNDVMLSVTLNAIMLSVAMLNALSVSMLNALSVAILNALSVAMLNALSVAMLNVIMLSVVMLNVIMLNVMVQQLKQIDPQQFMCQISFKANGEGNYEKRSMSIKN
jgi:hypothetical protein